MSVILFDGKTAAGQAVEAAITPTHLDLQGSDGAVVASWPLATLSRTDVYGPADNATFRSGNGPERLAISDPSLLAALRRAGAIRATQGAWSVRLWAGLGLGLVAAALVAGLLIDRMPDLLVPFVPRHLERGWSRTIESVVVAGNAPCTGAKGEAALALLMSRLAAGAGIDPPPPLAVLDSPLVNAFTLPDGRIVLLRGLIARASTPDEVSGVLAHELGHVRHRDPTREMLRRLELNMLARSVGWGADVAGQMTALSYSRRAEANADASALATLRRAGLRADGLARFFTELRRGDQNDGFPAFLSDHPTDASRVALLQAGPEGDTALDADAWSAVRDMCATPSHGARSNP